VSCDIHVTTELDRCSPEFQHNTCRANWFIVRSHGVSMLQQLRSKHCWSDSSTTTKFVIGTSVSLMIGLSSKPFVELGTHSLLESCYWGFGTKKWLEDELSTCIIDRTWNINWSSVNAFMVEPSIINRLSSRGINSKLDPKSILGTVARSSSCIVFTSLVSISSKYFVEHNSVSHVTAANRNKAREK